jgi:hypothetical protein
MFIATNAGQDLAPLGAKHHWTLGEQGKDYCAPLELRRKDEPPGYKHLAPLRQGTTQCDVALAS